MFQENSMQFLETEKRCKQTGRVELAYKKKKGHTIQ